MSSCDFPCINTGQFDAGCRCKGIVKDGPKWGSRQDVLSIIEKHYRENFDVLVKRTSMSIGCKADAEDVIQSAYIWCLENWDKLNKQRQPEFHKWFRGAYLNALKAHRKEERNIGMVMVEGEVF